MIKSQDIKYVIVQSGGKGTRMGHYAQNRPKCLVPVNGIPMILNTMEVYKDRKIIIIGDHLVDVLDSYLDSFASNYDYQIVRTEELGTAGGLTKAVSFIPDGEPFIVTWSDLFFEEEQEFILETELLVGLSNTFKCRWKYDDGFVNESSTECGVSGFFAFWDKSKFNKLSTEKSLVRGFLTEQLSMQVVLISHCLKAKNYQFRDIIASITNSKNVGQWAWFKQREISTYRKRLCRRS